MVGADLTGSDLESLQARSWVLKDTDFSGGRLGGAKFDNCRLDGAIFRKADLDFANFVGSTLVGADFTDATYSHYLRLAGTNLLHAKGLTSDAMQRAFDEGAVEMTPEAFRNWANKGEYFPSDKGDRTNWKENGFAIDAQSGKPLLKDGTPPSVLEKVDHSG